MKIIDNRYRIERLIEKDISYEYYLVTDLMDGYAEKVLTIFEYNGNEEIVEFFIENYLVFSEFEHKNLKRNLSFSLAHNIDSKPARIKYYYVIGEYIPGTRLSYKNQSLSMEERKKIFAEVLDVIDYLHFRGVVYGVLNPDDIYVLEDKSIAVSDVGNAIIKRNRGDYDEESRLYMSPELLMKKDKYDNTVDYYSLEAIYKFMFDEEKTIEEIRELYGGEASEKLAITRDKLYYKGKIVGRDKQLEVLIGKGSSGKSALISGNYGSGKSRFLQEINYRLTMQGFYVYQLGLKNEKLNSLDFLINFASKISGDSSSNQTQEYRLEINGIINSGMSSEGNRYKLYNRICNMLTTISKEKTIYLLIDDFNNGDNFAIESLDYLLKNTLNSNVVFYLTYNYNTINKQQEKEEKIQGWRKLGLIDIVDLPELTLDEVGDRLKAILGISYRPMDFASVIYRESRGNPRYIKQIIRFLYEQGELYMDDDGRWKLKADEFSQITFPPVKDSDFEKQLQAIVDEHYEYFKLLSICDETVPGEWLLRQLKEKKSTVDANLKVLLEKGLLLEEKRAYGFSYRTKNYELKRSIYSMIPEEEKIQLHSDLARYLQSNFSMDDFYYLEKVLFHLAKAGKGQEAFEIIKKQVKSSANQSGPTLRFLWERAYSLDFEKTPEIQLEILDNLLRVLLPGSDTKKSKVYLEEYGKIALENYNKHHMANYKKRMIDIYMIASEIDKAMEEIEDVEEKSKMMDCHRGQIIGLMSRGKLLFDEGKFNEAYSILLEAKELAEEKNESEFFHVISNRMGLCKHYSGNYEEAEKLYSLSLEQSKAYGDFYEMTRPMNNLAILYSEVYEDFEKAKDYYNRGLTIATEHDFSEMAMVLAANLAENYMDSGEYEVALGYYEKANVGAIELQDFITEVLANVKMGLIYLNQSRYNKAYEIYEHLKASQTESKVRNQEILAQYYEFLGMFYTSTGYVRRGYKKHNRGYKIAKEQNAKTALRMRAFMIFQRYILNERYDKEEIEEVRKEYQKTRLKEDRKRILTQMSLISLLHSDTAYAKELLEEADGIPALRPDRDEESARRIAESLLIKDKDKFLDYLVKAESDFVTENMLKEMIFKIKLAGCLYRRHRDKEALLYLLESVDLCYSLALQIPYKEDKINFIKFAGFGEMKEVLTDIIKRNYNTEIAFPSLEVEKTEHLAEFFDMGSILDAIGIGNFLKLYQPGYYGDAVNIKSVEELVASLTQDSSYNIDLILKFMARISFAKKAIIVGYNYIRNTYFTLGSLSKEKDLDFNANLLKLSRDTGGIIIDAGAEYETKGIGKYLGEGIKSIMVVPINEPETSEIEIDRRMGKRRSRVNLYLYFETDSVLNRMNQDVLATIQNLTKLLLINLDSQRFESIASTDKLTNTYTRKYFELRFKELSELAGEEGLKYSVLMLDIDKFKPINDIYGHKKGDQVLTEVGAILRESTRFSDLVGRYGGEEFVIVLVDVDPKDALRIGERIRQVISNHKFTDIDKTITASIGISHHPKDGSFGDELIEKADQALYNAKENGRNRVKEWKKGMLMVRKRVDKLAGIIQGNTEQDNRNLLSLIESMELVEEAADPDEKALTLLSRLFEVTGAQQGAMLIFENDQLIDIYAANHKEKRKLYSFKYNEEIVDKVLKTGEGQCLIDWGLVNYKAEEGKVPDWQSLIVVPLIKNGNTFGVLYLSVNLSVKEFKQEDLNLVRAFSSIGAAIIERF